ADFEIELPDRFQKRKTFDIAGGSADLSNDDVVFRFVRNFADPIFDFVGHMRNYLDGFSEIIAATFFQDDRFVNLSAGEIVVTRKNAIGEALVMSEVEIGL